MCSIAQAESNIVYSNLRLYLGCIFYTEDILVITDLNAQNQGVKVFWRQNDSKTGMLCTGKGVLNKSFKE